MRRTGYTNLPLHPGKAPRWLFGRMVKLAKEITEVILYEYSQDEFLKRLSNPYWFQAFSCVLGYDWHSSGTTTVTCGALKEALQNEGLGIAVCGGKGRVSRKTPNEIEKFSENFSLSTKKTDALVYASRMSAKVDNTAVQDDYSLYHHCFVFTEKGNWVVVQQGMNPTNRYARRYHWLSETVKSFIEEPHSAICSDMRQQNVLDMTSSANSDVRNTSVNVVNDSLNLPAHHEIRELTPRTISALQNAYELRPENYEELLAIRGIGPKAVRALALISEIIYGKELSWKDPAKFSFAHGGKDGIPFEINRKHYDSSIEILRTAIENARLSDEDRLNAIKRLHNFI